MRKAVITLAAAVLAQPLLLFPNASIAAGGVHSLMWSGTCGRFGSGTNNGASIINRCNYPISDCWTSSRNRGFEGRIDPGEVTPIPVGIFTDAQSLTGLLGPAGASLNCR